MSGLQEVPTGSTPPEGDFNSEESSSYASSPSTPDGTPRYSSHWAIWESGDEEEEAEASSVKITQDGNSPTVQDAQVPEGALKEIAYKEKKSAEEKAESDSESIQTPHPIC